MIKRLIETIPFENGELFSVTGGRQVMLAGCRPRAEIYEHAALVSVAGAKTAQVKSLHAAVVLYGDMDFTRTVDEVYLRTVSRFELAADVQRQDGIFERVVFDALELDEIDADGTWRFAVEDQSLIHKLLTI